MLMIVCDNIVKDCKHDLPRQNSSMCGVTHLRGFDILRLDQGSDRLRISPGLPRQLSRSRDATERSTPAIGADLEETETKHLQPCFLEMLSEEIISL